MITATRFLLINQRPPGPGHWIQAIVALLAIVLAPTLQAGTPVLPVAGQYLRDWLVLDDFLSAEWAAHFTSQWQAGSAQPVQEGEAWLAPGGQRLGWTRRHADSRSIVYRDRMDQNLQDRSAMLLTYLVHPAGGNVELEICSHSPIDVYVNGTQQPRIFSYRTDARYVVPYSVYEATLAPGTNSLLLRVLGLEQNYKLSVKAYPGDRAVISGRLAMLDGKPATQPVTVTVLDQARELAEVRMDQPAAYRCVVYPVPTNRCQLVARSAADGVQPVEMQVQPGQRISLDLVLSNMVSVAGRVTMLDPEQSPQISAVVQAVRNGQVAAAVRTGERGNFQFRYLPPGKYQVRCVTPLGSAVAEPGEIEVRPGRVARDLEIRCPPYKIGAWRKYGVFDGLAHDSVFCLKSALDGTLWLGTEGGISRFDGQRFTTLPGSEGFYVQALEVALDGSVWYGTLHGLRHARNGQTQSYTMKEGLAGNTINAIHAFPNGTVWIGTDSGISSYDGQRFRTYSIRDGLADNSVRCIHRDANQRIWIGTAAGLARWEGTNFLSFPALEMKNEPDVSAMVDDGRGGLWVGTLNGTFHFDGRNYAPVEELNLLPEKSCLSLHASAANLLWMGLTDSLAAYDGTHLVQYTVAEGIAGREIAGIWESPGGQIWLATSKGVSRFDPNFQRYTAQAGLANLRVLSVHSSPEYGLWAGTSEGGAARFDGWGFKTLYPAAYVRTFCQARDGLLYLGTARGVTGYNGTGFQTDSDILCPSQWTLALRDDQDQSLWIGHGWGGSGVDVFWKNAGGWQRTNYTTQHGLVSDQVYSILCARDGSKWFGTANGVSRLRESQWTSFTGTNHPSLNERRVWSLLEDRRGTLWIGTDQGLVRFNGREFQKCATQGPLNDHIWTVCQASDGRLWIGTANSGACIYDGQACASVDTRDGLVDNAVISFSEGADGRMWMGTVGGGVSVYRARASQPRIQIDSVLVGNQSCGSLASLPPVPVFGHVTVKYHAVDLVTLEQKQQYRLRLYQPAASGSPAEPFAWPGTRYDWEPQREGKYVLEIQSVGRDLSYSEPVRLAFTVFTPWHLQQRVILLGSTGFAGLLGSLLFLGYRVRHHRRQARQLEDQMREQERQALREFRQKNQELAESQQQLLNAKQQAESASLAKSVFLATMSHEIRTPLNVILGYAQLLQFQKDLAAENREAIQTIARSGNHLLGLLNDILDLSKIEAGHMELQEAPFDLSLLVRHLMAMFSLRCEQKGLAWKLDFNHPGPLMVLGDEGKLRQVLINLLGNAVKFTDAGEVCLRIAAWEGDRYQFEVADTGQGISAPDQALIFEAFSQGEQGRKKGGSGLGLAIARRQIEILGGRLGLATEAGRGSRFHFELRLPPTSLCAPPVLSQPLGPKLAAGRTLTALVVDDVQENREVLAGLLTAAGLTVRTAIDGLDALDKLREEMPEVVLSDIRMPRMDGQELARRVVAGWGDARPKLLAVTASVLAEEQAVFLDAGFDQILFKPIQATALYESLGRILGLRCEPDGHGPATAQPEGLPDPPGPEPTRR